MCVAKKSSSIPIDIGIQILAGSETYSVKCLVINRQVRGLRSAENQEFTFVNDWFSAQA